MSTIEIEAETAMRIAAALERIADALNPKNEDQLGILHHMIGIEEYVKELALPLDDIVESLAKMAERGSYE